jgi:catechol 2,3-dioxygenase-like lactoylglutathione lyase family enzyme
MPQHLSLVATVVDEYDTAIDYYVGTLGFELRGRGTEPDQAVGGGRTAWSF